MLCSFFFSSELQSQFWIYIQSRCGLVPNSYNFQTFWFGFNTFCQSLKPLNLVLTKLNSMYTLPNARERISIRGGVSQVWAFVKVEGMRTYEGWRVPKSRGETHLWVPQSQVAESWDLEARSRLPTLERGRGSSWEPRD